MDKIDISNSVFRDKDISEAVGQCKINECHISRCCSGLDVLELGVIDMSGNRHIILLRNMGSKIVKENVHVDIIDSREARNNVIRKLYNEHHLTQQFLAEYFKLSPSAISIIVKNKK